MQIGIIRHFKVDCKAKKFMNSEDFTEFVENYDTASVIKNEVQLDQKNWNVCYCSTLPRAMKTAKEVYSGPIIHTDLLREVPMSPRKNLKVRIPGIIWSVDSRIAWKQNSPSQLEGAKITERRADAFLKTLDFSQNKNVLIVSHGFFLYTLVRKLKKLGFKGRVPVKLPNGCLYVLSNDKNQD